MQSYHYIPAITIPTRYSNSNVPSLLDHIWLNKIFSFQSGTIMSDVTDHLPTFLTLPYLVNTNIPAPVKISFRHADSNSKTKFRAMIREFDWHSVMGVSIHDSMDNFINKLNFIYCKCFPLKYKFISHKKANNPWVNHNITELLEAKSVYFNLHKLGSSERGKQQKYK